VAQSGLHLDQCETYSCKENQKIGYQELRNVGGFTISKHERLQNSVKFNEIIYAAATNQIYLPSGISEKKGT
jgi:hypothetical protein